MEAFFRNVPAFQDEYRWSRFIGISMGQECTSKNK